MQETSIEGDKGKPHWSLEEIDWGAFDASKIDSPLVKMVKAASLVELNAPDYGVYLRRVFQKDPVFLKAIDQWVREEQQHGQALAKWVQLTDPSFSLEDSLQRFQGLFRVPLDAHASIRGSSAGELLARCVVETGTSSFYTALKEAVAEPVLQQICQKIAADELRHYKLFYIHMKRYLKDEPLGLAKRLKIAVQRLLENEDDELASAYFAANFSEGVYNHAVSSKALLSQVYVLYKPHHIERGLVMILKAVGIKPYAFFVKFLQKFLWILLLSKTKRLQKSFCFFS